MKKILITRKLLKSNEERISKLWDAKFNLNDEVYSQNKLIELSKDCDGILSSILDKIDEETINKLSDSVKIISNFAVGFGNIDIKVAKQRNIIVTNTPDVLTDATAEIIGSDKFMLYDDYYELFKEDGQLSNENLFELQFSDYGQATGDVNNHLFAPFGPPSWTPVVSTASSGWGFYEPSLKYIKFMILFGKY